MKSLCRCALVALTTGASAFGAVLFAASAIGGEAGGPDAALPKGVGEMLRGVAKLIVMDPPKDARWVHVTYKTMVDDEVETLEVGGWLLGEDRREYRVLDYFGGLRRFGKRIATIAPRTLLDEAKALADAREKLTKLYQRDWDDMDWRELSRLQSMLLCHGEGGWSEEDELPATFLSIPEALVAAWSHARGDSRVAKSVFVPRLIPARRAAEYLPEIRERLFDHYRRAMVYEFGARDIDTTLTYASHLSKPLFKEYDQRQPIELAEQLATRRDDFKTFTLPTPEQWLELKKGMTARQQVEYLAKRLRLLICWSDAYDGAQYGEPQDARPARWYEDEAKAVRAINPYNELWRLDLPELPALAPFLADRSFMPTYRIDHRGGRGAYPVLYRTCDAVVRIINHVAMEDLVERREVEIGTEEKQRQQIDHVLGWCKAHAGKTRVELVLETMGTTEHWGPFGACAYVLMEAKHAQALPLLDRRVNDFPGKRGRVVRIMHALDVPEAVPYARKWIRDRDPEVRLWAALVLLRHGDKAKLEGLDVLRAVLERAEGEQALVFFTWAMDDLLTARREEATKVACLLVGKDPLAVAPDWMYVSSRLLHRLFLAGRRECLDHVLAKLDSRRLVKVDRGARRELEADRVALELSVWQPPRHRVYSDRAAPAARERAREEFKAWLRESFQLIRSGKKASITTELHFLLPEPYRDPWEDPLLE